MIGLIVATICQELLGKTPITRLALSLDGVTEAKFNSVITALPQEIQDTWTLLCPPTLGEDERLYVEMRPTPLSLPRDPLAEIDKINEKLDLLLKKEK